MEAVERGQAGQAQRRRRPLVAMNSEQAEPAGALETYEERGILKTSRIIHST